MSIIDIGNAYQNKRVLAIVLGSKTFLYELNGKDFRVGIPNDLQAQTTIEKIGNVIYVRVPNPGDGHLSGPTDSTSITIRRGQFVLKRGQCFSFNLEKVVTGRSDICYDGLLRAPLIKDLGPRGIESFKQFDPPKRWFGKITFTCRGEGCWSGDFLFIRVGHTYAVELSPGGPYALVQVLEHDESADWIPDFNVTLIYAYQSDGTPRF